MKSLWDTDKTVTMRISKTMHTQIQLGLLMETSKEENKIVIL
jgi:hypothetical protein